ncbi:MAG: Penicillin amidase [Solirubrobacterales bacterium]|jgi:acyl-homoserine-lactone acylase|nr:Penicillin amidase [Solirubrobacterales bacterium]
MGRGNVGVLAVLLAGAITAEAAAAPPKVTIRRDAHGTPHIVAKDFRSMGYGFARAHAEDNLCGRSRTLVARVR